MKKDIIAVTKVPANIDAPLQCGDEHSEIRFYRSNEKPYGAFSNLFRRSILFEGRIYPTSEHAYQAGKVRKDSVREWLLSAPSPALVAMVAHGLYTWDIVPNWSAIKFERMRQVLRAKFSQHEDLHSLLISTGEARIVEVGTADNAVNRLWGEVKGKGKNMLGIILMEVRADLRIRASLPQREKETHMLRSPKYIAQGCCEQREIE